MTRKKKRSLGIFGSKIGKEVLINLPTYERKALADLPSLKKIKTWNAFIHWAESHNVKPGNAIVPVARHIQAHWKEYKIKRDLIGVDQIYYLLLMHKKLKKRLYVSKYLKDWAAMTGYRIPTAEKTFNNHITEFKKLFAASRSHDGTFSKERMLKEAASKIPGRKKIGGKHSR